MRRFRLCVYSSVTHNPSVMKIDSSVGSLAENRARAIGMFHILKNDTWARVDMEFLFEFLTR